MKIIMRNTNKIVVCMLLLFGIIALFAFGLALDNFETEQPVEEKSDNDNPYIEFSQLDNEIPLVGDIVLEWTKGELTALELHQTYSGSVRVYCSRPAQLNYSIFNIPTGEKIVSQTLELSLTPSFEDAKQYDIENNKRSVTIDYLFTDSIYYYRLTVAFSDGSDTSTVGQFKTADTPRILMFDGAYNVRDIGGYKTTDGRKIKQGMLYRGTELDGNLNERFTLDLESARIMREELGIRTELDLRAESQDTAGNMIGEDCDHRYYALLVAYEKMFTDQGKKAMKKIFSDFASEEIFPGYIHCSYGTDRTGMVVFFLQAVLGVSEEDLYNEWELSTLYNGGAFYEDMEAFLKLFRDLDGKTTKEKAENYLLSTGVTEQQIESIRDILLEE